MDLWQISCGQGHPVWSGMNGTGLGKLSINSYIYIYIVKVIIDIILILCMIYQLKKSKRWMIQND